MRSINQSCLFTFSGLWPHPALGRTAVAILLHFTLAGDFSLTLCRHHAKAISSIRAI